jgi:hypothetical protein
MGICAIPEQVPLTESSAEFQMTQEPRAPQPIFDLPTAKGVNTSERILTELCQRTFLRLWSQTNVFTDEGFRDGKGSTRELCDALVIFGNDVIIFSDKHIDFQQHRELKVAWPRWYKRAVSESCRQLYGALSWLIRFPDRAFLDAKCTRKLAVPVPNTAPTFHLVAVTRGSRDAALKSHAGGGLGTLGLNSSIEGNAHLEQPFVIGLPDPTKKFVHVFDEVAIGLVLGELDTAADFLDYLKKRELLLGRKGSAVLAVGEEELLGTFMQTMSADETEHVFATIEPGEPVPDMVVFGGGVWESLQKDPAYARKKQADRISYEWDRLIDRFIEYGDAGAYGALLKQTGAQSEQGLRWMAAENRYRRRQLAQSFIGAMERVEPGGRIGRMVYGGVADEPVFVFLVKSKRKEESYEDYRQYRVALLHAYVQAARLQAPLGTVFVGIAFDNPHKSYRGGSEDLFALFKESWTDAELQELEAKRLELGLWKRGPQVSRHRQDEFPKPDQFMPFVKDYGSEEPPASSKVERSKKKGDKRAQKARAASQRRNRGKKR